VLFSDLVFGGLLIEIYNMELENAKKLNQSPGLNTFKELISFHVRLKKWENRNEKAIQDWNEFFFVAGEILENVAGE